MGVGKGNGPGSLATRFKRTLASRPPSLYKRGPRKGQPRICRLCPNFVPENSQKERLCAAHLYAYRESYRRRAAARATERSQRRWLNPEKTLKPLQSYAHRAQTKGYQGIFGHMPESAQTIAHHELQLMLTRHPEVTAGSRRYAAMVASASVMASYGGRKAWAKAMWSIRMQQAYARKRLLSEAAPKSS